MLSKRNCVIVGILVIAFVAIIVAIHTIFVSTRKNKDFFPSSFAPFSIPFAVSNDVEIADGAWQYYRPTNNSYLYLPPDGYLRLDISLIQDAEWIVIKGLIYTNRTLHLIWTDNTLIELLDWKDTHTNGPY